MRLKLYCNRYAHFKDALVCSVNCGYRTRCRDFALFYDEHRDNVDTLVANYFEARKQQGEQSPLVPAARALPVLAAPAIEPVGLIRLEVKKEMNAFVWIGQDDRAEVMDLDELLRRAEGGIKAKHIYKVAQEMELRFQLVPRKGIEKAKRLAAATAAAETGRAAARRARGSAAVEQTAIDVLASPTAPQENGNAATRRTRSRAVKVGSEK